MCEVMAVNEYILICPTKEGQKMLPHVPGMLQYLLTGDFHDNYEDLLYQCWAYPLDSMDEYLDVAFKDRYDYRHEDHLHTLYNELTKEISIIIVNRYQIILKCDKIPDVVVRTIKRYYPSVCLFCRNQNFKEVYV